MMSNILPTVLAAAESNNLTQLKDALDAWSTQEIPEAPKVLGQPMYSFQPALEIAFKLRHVDVADELLHRGCWISPGSPSLLSTIIIYTNKSLAGAVVATSGGCTERSGWDTRSFEVLFKHDWDINECLGHIGDALMFVFFFHSLNLMA